MKDQYYDVIALEVWNREVALYIGGSLFDAQLHFSRLVSCDEPEPSDGSNGVSWAVSGYVGIWIADDSLSADWVGTVTHESLHAANMIMQNAGVEANKGQDGWLNDEPLAYTAGFIAKSITELCLELRGNQLPGSL